MRPWVQQLLYLVTVAFLLGGLLYEVFGGAP